MTYDAYGEQMEDRVSIDWSKPIEAYHEDGRVAEARPETIYTPFNFKSAWSGKCGGRNVDAWTGHWDDAGNPETPNCKWRIRNVSAKPSRTYEDGIRDALAALPPVEWPAPNVEASARYHGIEDARRAITALMAKDEAKALVDEWIAAPEEDCDPNENVPSDTVRFARWLLDTGKIKGV